MTSPGACTASLKQQMVHTFSSVGTMITAYIKNGDLYGIKVDTIQMMDFNEEE